MKPSNRSLAQLYNLLFIFRPCVVYKNPLVHSIIKVMTGISLDANEVLVVYRQDDETKNVDRYLQHGPTLFIPDANEWYLCSTFSLVYGL